MVKTTSDKIIKQEKTQVQVEFTNETRTSVTTMTLDFMESRERQSERQNLEGI